MHITFTRSAAEKLSSYYEGDTRKLKLLYDTDGCGCAVNGVPALQLITEPSETISKLRAILSNSGMSRPIKCFSSRRFESIILPQRTAIVYNAIVKFTPPTFVS